MTHAAHATPEHRLSATEIMLAAIAMLLSMAPGFLLALWMPWREAGALFGVIWGTLLGAMISGIVVMRLNERLARTISVLRKRSRRLPVIPSYAITPETPAARPSAVHSPMPAVAPKPEPQLFHDPIPAALITPLTPPLIPAFTPPDQEATFEDREMTTEKLDGFAKPDDEAPDDPTPDDEATLSELNRPTAHVKLPQSMLMSMDQLNDEITRPDQPFTHDTKQFNTPQPMLEALSSPKETSEAHDAQHFTNRQTIPLDANTVQSFLSDQRHTQRIDNLAELVSQELKRPDAQT